MLEPWGFENTGLSSKRSDTGWHPCGSRDKLRASGFRVSRWEKQKIFVKLSGQEQVILQHHFAVPRHVEQHVGGNNQLSFLLHIQDLDTPGHSIASPRIACSLNSCFAMFGFGCGHISLEEPHKLEMEKERTYATQVPVPSIFMHIHISSLSLSLSL